MAFSNFLRYVGDFCHLASFFILILRLYKTRNASGISLKTQELYLLVFLARYTDLLFRFVSWYNTVMKLVYIGTSAWIVYMFYAVPVYKRTYDKGLDSFMHWKFAVAPCAVLALVANEGWGASSTGMWLFEYLWAFSIYLEAVAIFPQLIMLQRHKDTSNLTMHYCFALGIYRALYLINWVLRFGYSGHLDLIAFLSGLVQTAFYVDFFYEYYRAMLPTLPGGGGGSSAAVPQRRGFAHRVSKALGMAPRQD